MWDYTDKVRDHFKNPRNIGFIKEADGIGEVGSMACGDALRLMFKLDDDGKITEAKFQTFGCASAIASSSVLTEMMIGLTLEEAEKITNQEIADRLGGLPDQKMHCSVLGREALEAAILDHRKRKGGEIPEKKEESRLVCICFGVTEEEVERAIRENNLTTVEDVTNYTKAGGGCGGCHEDIAQIIEKITGRPPEEKEKEVKEPSKKNLTNIQKIQLIQETIDREIRPILQKDGGDLELIDVDRNVVQVSLRGTCSQCRVASFTLRDVVEAKLREFVTEDLVVEEVQ